MEEYVTPFGYGEDEIMEKKSRFIGHIWHIGDQEDALSKIKETRTKHWDASHNVYAYILREGGTMRYSDDGEPQGTAGMPVLEVLRREGVVDVCAVVTRYFGGTLLGAGGLLRAYAKCAKAALDAAGKKLWKKWIYVKITCPYQLYEKLRAAIPALGGLEDETVYGADIEIFVYFPDEICAAALTGITDLTAGKALWEKTREEFMGVGI